MSRQLRQCYLCTARLTGCGEYLDPSSASKYIHPCTSSCIVFRNPGDHNCMYNIDDILPNSFIFKL